MEINLTFVASHRIILVQCSERDVMRGYKENMLANKMSIQEDDKEEEEEGKKQKKK